MTIQGRGVARGGARGAKAPPFELARALRRTVPARLPLFDAYTMRSLCVCACVLLPGQARRTPGDLQTGWPIACSLYHDA